MGRFIDMTGKRFGRLVVTGRVGTSSNGSVTWRCRCDCGTECTIVGNSLRSGLTKSCGCLSRETRERNFALIRSGFIDLTGRRFGKLQALHISHKDGIVLYWFCHCDCGNSAVIRGHYLRAGITKSCGCAGDNAKRKRINPEGCKFGRLRAIRQISRGNNNTLWLCECDCGGLVEVSPGHLASGHTRSCGCLRAEYRLKITGENNRNWKGGADALGKLARKGRQFTDWRKAVIIRDGHICRKCDGGNDINAHHIYNFSEYKALRYDPDNGVALCGRCHRKYHGKYGYANGNADKIIEFLNQRPLKVAS